MQTNVKSISVVFLAVVSLCIFPYLTESSAQEPFPTRPITMIGKNAAGGMSDVMLRAISRAAEKELGQPLLVENKPGGNGIVALTYVSKAKPDGYTLGDAATSNFTIIPQMQRVSYNPLTDFIQIIVHYKYSLALAVRADSPFKTFEDIIQFARKNPGKFTYGNSGIGTTQHIVMERIALKEGIRWKMVPFNSGAQSTIASLGGHVDAATQGPADLVQYIKAGKLRLLLVLDDERWAVDSSVPTALEKYGFCGRSVQSIFGPKGMPDRIVNILHNAFKKAANDQAYIDASTTANVELRYKSGEDYDKIWKPDYEAMGKTLDGMGLKAK